MIENKKNSKSNKNNNNLNDNKQIFIKKQKDQKNYKTQSISNQTIKTDNLDKKNNQNKNKKNGFEKIKKWSNSYNNFVIKHERKIYFYYFYSSILIFVLMFFVSLFINANFGYQINGIEFQKKYFLLTTGIVLGFISFFLYLPIFIFSITQFVEMIKKKKFDFMFYWMIFIQTFNLYFFLTIIIFSILNYKLFYIHEIIYIFMILAFWSLQNKNKINFIKFNKKSESIKK